MNLILMQQPISNLIYSCYNPIDFRVLAELTEVDESKPVAVYAYIYVISDTNLTQSTLFVKLSRTVYDNPAIDIYEFNFDIHTAVQSLFSMMFPSNVSLAEKNTSNIKKIYCEFKYGALSENGFVQEDDNVLIKSNEFYIINSVNKFEYELSSTNYILDRPKKSTIAIDHNDFFPFLTEYKVTKARLRYKLIGNASEAETEKAINIPLIQNGYLQFGPKQLRSVFKTVNFKDVEYYYFIIASEFESEAVESPKQYITRCKNTLRLFFINYFGVVDSIEVHKIEVSHNTRSGEYYSAGNHRLNIVANDFFTVKTNKLNESDLAFVQQIFDSPKSWISTTENMIEPIILDNESGFVKHKEANRFAYEVYINFRYSNKIKTLRG